MSSVTVPPAGNPVDLIVAKLHTTSNDFFLQLPNIVGGLVFVIVAWFAGRMRANGVRRGFHHKGLIDLGVVLASLTYGLVVALAVMIASVIICSSVKPATIISSLGIGSVAIGFAFEDILQNLLACILLLVNRPDRRGDQIVVKDYEGTVEHAQSRATLSEHIRVGSDSRYDLVQERPAGAAAHRNELEQRRPGAAAPIVSLSAASHPASPEWHRDRPKEGWPTSGRHGSALRHARPGPLFASRSHVH